MRRRNPWKRAQSMVEVIILVALCTLALAWLVTALPEAIEAHFDHNQKIIASPL